MIKEYLYIWISYWSLQHSDVPKLIWCKICLCSDRVVVPAPNEALQVQFEAWKNCVMDTKEV